MKRVATKSYHTRDPHFNLICVNDNAWDTSKALSYILGIAKLSVVVKIALLNYTGGEYNVDSCVCDIYSWLNLDLYIKPAEANTSLLSS